MEIRKKEEPLTLITEWDKSRIKPLFKSFDKDKKGFIPLEKLPELFTMISADTNFVGKVPACTQQEFVILLTPQRELVEKGTEQKEAPTTISWDDFRFNLNKFFWRKPDLNQTNSRIKDLYYQANKKIYSGDMPTAKEILYKAIKIESELGATETHKVLMKKAERAEKLNPRVDSFNFGKFTFRKEFECTEKIAI